MLEHSAMYLNVTPPYEDDTSFFPDFYSTRLGPCELQDPVWAKMSALAAGVNKKRKKSETKPQAQINKCNNEKRRREQENIYIEELAELISANFADMSSLSVKPDKCAILQETVNQIRSIKQRESAQQAADPVQQGEVSSSRPTILSNEVYGPLLLEALEGFLFVVNSEGKVEHVTENVATYIKFTREDVLGKSIYNFIHHGDHAKFHSNLLPMTIEWGNEAPITNRSKSIDIRLLVKPPDDLDESVEEKQQRVSCYELMHISSTQLRDQLSVSEEDGSDSGPCLLCVASRISHRDKATCSIEQFTTKLDPAGKIICVDTSGVSEVIAQYIKKDLKNRVLRDLVSQQEVHKINAHLRETVSQGQSTSAIYRLQVGPDKFIQVQTKSKLFKTNPHATNDTDFIMATHSIIGENEAIGPTDPGGGTSSTSGVGGPLMTSIVNGTRNSAAGGSDSSTTSSSTTLLNTNAAASFATTFNLDNDFSFDFLPSSTWELESAQWQDTAGRPDSRQSVTPVSTPTPRPPSNPSYSNAPTVVQSPLAHFQTQPSPTVQNPPTPANPYASTFPFSPLNDPTYASVEQQEQKDTKANVLEEAAMMADSHRLRILLTKPPNNADSGNDDKNRDRILKELLNQQDEDGGRTDNRSSPRGLMNRGPMPGPSEPPKSSSSSSGNNDMLRKLLNDKSDDDDHEAKAGMKTKSELLQQLLKTERDQEEDKKNDMQSQDDTLLRSLGFPPSSPGDRGRKRSSDDKDDNPNKRSSDGSQVSSSGPSSGSKLCERNKMLASLLAIQPSNHQPIPPIPASVISATPQEKLPRITDPNKSIQMGMMNTTNMQNMLNNSRMTVSRMPGRPPQTTNYLNAALSAASMQRGGNENARQINQVNSVGCYTSPATSSTDNNNTGWDNNNLQTSNDPLLSDILDQVIDIVPDDIMHLLDGSDGQQGNNFQMGLSETMAINIIQKSLMQCESVVKSPGSPISMPGTPPAYSSANMTNNQSGGNVFPPPPKYSQAQFQRMQVRAGVASPQYAANISQQLQLQHRTKQLLHQQQQQEQKRRLLQQQKQQQLLIPSNAAANEINPMQNIDSLLNNTVAPNVSLQRSSSVPEPQLSPGYVQQNQRVGNQQPYSPHSQLTSPLGQQTFPQTTAGSYQNRLSPQQVQFSAQLSPRQAYPQGNAQQTANWQQQQQQQQARLSVQQNPMLSAQLTRPPQQQQRSINSPGTVPTRHSPYPTDQFQPPSSPNSAFNSQYLRLQRANSAPTAPTQLPGVSGSGPTSEFVRQELRAVVGARTAQAQPPPPPPPTAANRPTAQLMSQQQQDLESLGINFEMATGASDSPKLWGAIGSDMGSMSPTQPASSRSTLEEARAGDQKSSLLQKLLSE